MVIYITPRHLFQILPTRHIITLTNLVCRIGLIRINITHAPNLITIIFRIILTLHRVNGDSPPLSPIFNQLVLLIHLVHNISKIHTQFHQSKIENHQFWKWVCVSPNNNHKIWWTHNFTTNSKIILHLFKSNRNKIMNLSTKKRCLKPWLRLKMLVIMT